MSEPIQIENLENEEQADVPRYYFAGGFDHNLQPTLDVGRVTRTHDLQTLKLGSFDTLAEAFEAEQALVELEESSGLTAAMHRAEEMAVAAGTLDPVRADGRLFSGDVEDPFVTRRQQELENLTYRYDIVDTPRNTVEVHAVKAWDIAGESGEQRLVLDEYDRAADARSLVEILTREGQHSGREAELAAIETVAVETGTLTADRLDPRLFNEGPPDPFTSNRERELALTNNYMFRAGPAIEDDLTLNPTRYSLDLVNVAREGGQYRASANEFMRVAAQDAEYVEDAANRLNRMMAEVGTGPAVSAATAWSRHHGATVDSTWRDVPLDMLTAELEPESTPVKSMKTPSLEL